jgi:hypothetical protein
MHLQLSSGRGTSFSREEPRLSSPLAHCRVWVSAGAGGERGLRQMPGEPFPDPARCPHPLISMEQFCLLGIQVPSWPAIHTLAPPSRWLQDAPLWFLGLLCSLKRSQHGPHSHPYLRPLPAAFTCPQPGYKSTHSTCHPTQETARGSFPNPGPPPAGQAPSSMSRRLGSQLRMGSGSISPCWRQLVSFLCLLHPNPVFPGEAKWQGDRSRLAGSSTSADQFRDF